jgi:hypothetical protein
MHIFDLMNSRRRFAFFTQQPNVAGVRCRVVCATFPSESTIVKLQREILLLTPLWHVAIDPVPLQAPTNTNTNTNTTHSIMKSKIGAGEGGCGHIMIRDVGWWWQKEGALVKEVVIQGQDHLPHPVGPKVPCSNQCTTATQRLFLLCFRFT